MRTQVLKVTMPHHFTVEFDSEAQYPCQYSIYYHTHKPNTNGVYTRRKYLVDKVWDMNMCLAWIMDVNNNPDVLKNAWSKELKKGV